MSVHKKLSDKIRDAKRNNSDLPKDSKINTKIEVGYSQAINVSIELITGIALGAISGYFLDNWLNTKPLMIIILIIVGTAVGFYNAFKTIKKYGYFSNDN